MGFYDKFILPSLINTACSSPQIMAVREKVVPLATGEVLEIGAGSGTNFSFYDPEKVSTLWALEPSEEMRKKANTKQLLMPFHWLDLPGEAIPLDDNSIDTLILTFTLCTIPDWHAALTQMRRVLKPSGKLFFCEHGLSPDSDVQRWQHRITPYWKKAAGGCHLNRPVIEHLEKGGFKIEEHHSDYVRNTPKIAGYVTYGVASI